jgi:hypothetical protein
MEFSRCHTPGTLALHLPTNVKMDKMDVTGGSYVERAETLAVGIELVVVKLDELLWKTATLATRPEVGYGGREVYDLLATSAKSVQ